MGHVPRLIVNVDHSIVRAAVMLGIPDCIANRIRLAVPQATEWQGIADEIDASFVLASADFVNVHQSRTRALFMNTAQAQKTYTTKV